LKLLIHDLNEQDFSQLGIIEDDYKVINANTASAPCFGCFNCWFVTPGICKSNDYLQNKGFGNSEEMVLISQNCYGGYSEQVKKTLDRSVPSSLPYFTYRSRKIRHIKRYRINRKQLTVILYGDFLESERKAAELMVKTNRSNMGFNNANLYLINNISEIKQVLK